MTKKKPKTWVYSPPKPAKVAVPETLTVEVERRANELVEAVLKPKHVQTPPHDARFNYLIGLSTKWHGPYFYFVSTYACPGPDALAPSFEAKFARLEHVGGGKFNLAFMRHTGKWVELFAGLTLDECLKAVAEDPLVLAVGAGFVMTDEQLRRIESELAVSLPDDYRTVMLAFPFRPIGNDRVYWLYDDPEAVIGATRHPLNEFYEGRSWRPSYLSIGETAMGDQYLLNLARTPSPVFCLSHETHEVEEDYPDFTAFVAGWTREVAQAREMMERQRAKKWWKFW